MAGSKTINPAELDQKERSELAQAEATALKAWQERGSGRRPATPVTDYLALNPEPKSTRKVGEPTGAFPLDETIPFAYWIGKAGSGVADRLVGETQHSVSYMAGYTKTSDEPRMGVKELTAAMHAAGIVDIDGTTWEFLLPQCGRLVRHIPIPGRKLPDGTVIVASENDPRQGVIPSVKPARKRAPRKAAAAKKEVAA